jgi:hypothetical protein
MRYQAVFSSMLIICKVRFTQGKKIKMYPQPSGQIPMAPPQKPETFMLSTEAQRSLPHDAQVALQQVDNRMSLGLYPRIKAVY